MLVPTNTNENKNRRSEAIAAPGSRSPLGGRERSEDAVKPQENPQDAVKPLVVAAAKNYTRKTRGPNSTPN